MAIHPIFRQILDDWQATSGQKEQARASAYPKRSECWLGFEMLSECPNQCKGTCGYQPRVELPNPPPFEYYPYAAEADMEADMGAGPKGWDMIEAGLEEAQPKVECHDGRRFIPRECPDCWGAGRYRDAWDNHLGECQTCHGKGNVLDPIDPPR